MTYEELKKTGKRGVYRPDLDEWFAEGEEPAPAIPTSEPVVIEPDPAPQSKDADDTTVTSTKKGAANG